MISYKSPVYVCVICISSLPPSLFPSFLPSLPPFFSLSFSPLSIYFHLLCLGDVDSLVGGDDEEEGDIGKREIDWCGSLKSSRKVQCSSVVPGVACLTATTILWPGRRE